MSLCFGQKKPSVYNPEVYQNPKLKLFNVAKPLQATIAAPKAPILPVQILKANKADRETLL